MFNLCSVRDVGKLKPFFLRWVVLAFQATPTTQQKVSQVAIYQRKTGP